MLGYNNDALYSVLSDHLSNITRKIIDNDDISYDAQISALLGIWDKLKLPANIEVIQEYVNVVLEKEASFKYEYISSSLIRCLAILIDNNSCSTDQWKYLYETANKELAHIFIGAIFLQSGFDFDLFVDACLNCNTQQLIPLIFNFEILSPYELGIESQNLPQNVKDKIKNDSLKQENKNIVYN